ncbi:MAG: Nucleoside triphosphate pyrophosphohydrolase [Alphaproteobacteria bacterium ADurb.Bin438]|nr:MAG: Nucleoside triphosphate pyrophosphohydrolase [Alphaproteobacteria bacterium ADurb.Bin438]
MKRLRDKEKGCPWDKEQTRESLAKYAVEEAYEVMEAVMKKDDENFKEELGDLLMQVVFQSEIAEEEGKFNFDDVAKRINQKLIFRHPHVFGSDKANNSNEVLTIWEKAKQKEHQNESIESILDSVPSSLPSMLRAYKMQKKAAKVGFDWENVDGVIEKLKEEIEEFEQAKSRDEKIEELGDILFTCVNLARKIDIDPEEALFRTNLKFDNRVRFIEKSLKNQGKDIKSATMSEKEELWQKSKNN